jgi:DNA-binding transcriptional ArsR family regulator
VLEPRQEVFHAVVDPNRRRILHFLTAGECPVQDLVDRFDLSFSAISQHLKVLRTAGLVARRRRGRSQLYSLRPEPMKDLHDWTEIYQSAWREHLGRLRSLLEEDRRSRGPLDS